MVRYKEAEQEDVKHFGSAGLPAVIVVGRDGKEEVLSDSGKSRNEMRTAIMKKLTLSREMLSGESFKAKQFVSDLNQDEKC